MNVNPTVPDLYILHLEVQKVDYIGNLLRQRLNIIGKRVIKIFIPILYEAALNIN